jgi:hypothetical protein
MNIKVIKANVGIITEIIVIKAIKDIMDIKVITGIRITVPRIHPMCRY